MQLFDQVERGDPSPAGHKETGFTFLNRVATPYWGEVRRVMDEWFAKLPASEQADIGARFRSTDERQHLGAFWELYLREVFTLLGYEVSVHPTLPDATTNPDMLVERDGESFYVEAVTLTDKDADRQSSRKRAQVYDFINERVRSANFFLDVEIVRIGTCTPPLARLGRDLDQWLIALNPDDVPPLTNPRQEWNLPTHEARFDDWVFRFRAFPKGPDRRTAEGRIVGMYGPPEPVWVNDHDDLMDRIGRKSRKYGEPDRPLVIAVLYARWTADSHHLLRTLFGGAWGYPEMFRDATIPPDWQGKLDGLWLTRNGPRNRNGSAVLCATRLAPFFITRFVPWLVHHPWARHPLTASLPFAETRVILETGRAIETDGTFSPARFFGLPEEWPPGEPFPKDSNDG